MRDGGGAAGGAAMSRRMTVKVDPEAVSMAATIRRMAPIAPLLVVKTAALRDLAHELGGHDRAADFLLMIAEEIGHPIGVNLEREDGSQTVFIGPRDWTEERLAGWVGGHHAELEAQFGAAVPSRPNRAERRRQRGAG